jgi:NADH:ubiquinone reductase (H+-translocating)
VVILGCGFAGLEAARRLAGAGVRLTLIDSGREFVFRPLLSQLLAGKVARSAVAHALREVAGALPNATLECGTLEVIEPRARRILISGRPIAYDYLLLATGASPSAPSLAVPGALTLDSLGDWRRMDDALVRAAAGWRRSAAPSDRPRRRVIVVGGGPHGVELAAAVKARSDDLILRGSPLGEAELGVTLVHEGPRLLEGYPEAASRYAAEALAREGVQVLLNERVSPARLGPLTGGEPPADPIWVWAGGRRAPRLADVPGLGQAELAADLSVAGYPEVLVLGDLAAANAPSRFPALASAAIQTGQHAARAVRGDLAGTPRSAFFYLDQGYGTYIGREAAAVVLDGKVLTGSVAFGAKMTLHLALSTASAAFSPNAAKRGLAAIRKRLFTLPRGLGALERTPPPNEPGLRELTIESRIPGQTPAGVFAVARARIDDLFTRAGVPILERGMSADGHQRRRIRFGDRLALSVPVEVAFEPAGHTIVVTTLATHPWRARAVIALHADDGDTVVCQSNRYQLDGASAWTGRILGLERWIESFWRGFHDALREAASWPAKRPPSIGRRIGR